MFWNKNKKTTKVAPHLPKEVRQKGGEMIDRDKWFLQLFLLAVVFGFVSGIVGGMVVNSRFFDDWLWGEGGAWKSTVSSSRTESKSLSRDNLSRKALSIVFDIYPSSALGKDNLIDLNAKVGSGFFLTSSGFAATDYSIFEKFNKKDLLAINNEKKVFRFGQSFKDPISDLVILKMEGEGGGNLPFVSEEDIYPDLETWLPIINAGILQTKVVSADFWSPKSRADYYFNSEKIYRFGLAKDLFNKKDAGAPLINLRGEIVGMILNETDAGNNFNLFLKSSVIQTALKQILSNGEISRPYLGFYFQEVGNLVASKEGQNLKNGIILYNHPTSGLVFNNRTSPLVNFDFLAGDLILSINEETISPLRSLPEILLDYSSGDKLKIKYERGGVEKNIEITLGKIK